MHRHVIAVVLLAALVAGAWLVIAPSKIHHETLGPRAIHLGEEECAQCRMIVSEQRSAVERVLGADAVKVYDDPGCCLRELGRDRSGEVFFADSETGQWIPLAGVRFEVSSKPTPMGYGLAAVPVARASAKAIGVEQAIGVVVSGSLGRRE